MDAIITARIKWRHVCTPAELKVSGETFEQMVRRLIREIGLDTGDVPPEILTVELVTGAAHE